MPKCYGTLLGDKQTVSSEDCCTYEAETNVSGRAQLLLQMGMARKMVWV
jgi:hypothetical protein